MREKKLRSIILYYLLHSIRELGIDLPLLFRRISESASKDIKYISEEFFGGKMDIENFEQLINDLSAMLKQEGLVEDIEVTIADSNAKFIVRNCAYLDMAKKGKEKGENGCPVCLIALAASIASSTVEGYRFNATNYSTDVSKNECTIEISHIKE